MRVLVLGGTGFIGRVIARELAAAGHRVTVFSRGLRQAGLPPGVQRVTGDRGRLAECRGDLLSLRPEAVVDAAPSGEDSAGIVEMFRGRIRASVHLSSQAVYRAWEVAYLRAGDPEPVPLDEDSPLRSRRHLYGPGSYEPLAVEEAVLGQRGFPACVLRLGFVYGPGDRQAREWAVCGPLLAGREILLMGAGANWLWSRVYVEEVARAVALCLGATSKSMGKVYNLSEPRAQSLRGWALAVARAMGRPLRIAQVPDALLPPHLQLFAGRPQHMLAGSARIRQELRYAEQWDPDQALSRTVDWHIQHPPGGWPPPDFAAEDAALARARSLGLLAE